MKPLPAVRDAGRPIGRCIGRTPRRRSRVGGLPKRGMQGRRRHPACPPFSAGCRGCMPGRPVGSGGLTKWWGRCRVATMVIDGVDGMLLRLVHGEAERQGCSVEAWVRGAFYAQPAVVLPAGSGVALVATIRVRVEPLGGVDPVLPPRAPMRESPDFGWPAGAFHVLPSNAPDYRRRSAVCRGPRGRTDLQGAVVGVMRARRPACQSSKAPARMQRDERLCAEIQRAWGGNWRCSACRSAS